MHKLHISLSVEYALHMKQTLPIQFCFHLHLLSASLGNPIIISSRFLGCDHGLASGTDKDELAD
jgi:hypothetical protein